MAPSKPFFMLNQFTDEYKQIMLDAENRAKQFGYKEILPEDILLQISRLPKGNISDLFATFGINEGVVIDLLSRPPFLPQNGVRSGSYIGISPRLRDVIILSLKIAASFGKKQASTEDFLLALFEAPQEVWFPQMLDFVGIVPKDIQTQLIDINKLIS